jgi:hypothetical protein
MEQKSEGAIWLASYPKSGNTWLRCLLEAYRRNGLLDINDIRVSTADGGGILIDSVSPISRTDLGYQGEMLLRPAALMHLLARASDNKQLIKTHYANIQPPELPPAIPKQITKKAIYVVRDPRSVVLSISRFFKMPIDVAVEAMRNPGWTIGDSVGIYALCLVGSWSSHVGSWAGEKEFPVHVVRYEDMLEDPGKELRDVLNFLGEEVDEALVQKAVEVTQISHLRKQEEANGFKEHNKTSELNPFFGSGGTRWTEELGSKWVEAIEADHEKVMAALGYGLTTQKQDTIVSLKEVGNV